MYNIVYSEAAVQDLGWFTKYFDKTFPEGKSKAVPNLKQAIVLIQEFPEIGKFNNDEGVRELAITKTRFSICYKIEKDTIFIVRIFDNRSNPIFKYFQI